jgi:hypothetical protein
MHFLFTEIRLVGNRSKSRILQLEWNFLIIDYDTTDIQYVFCVAKGEKSIS